MRVPPRLTPDIGPVRVSSRQASLLLIMFGAIGVLYSLLVRLLIPPPSVLQKAFEPKQAPWIAPVQQFWDLLGSVEGSIAAFGIFALVAAYTRYRPRGLFCAFMAGVYLASALFRWTIA